MEGGGWQIIETWESEEALASFVNETIMPVAQELGAPPFDSQVVARYNSLIA